MDQLTYPIYMIPAILAVVLGFLIALYLLSRNYIKVPPNLAAVISGRSRKLSDVTVVGYRLVRGGATLIFPFLEKAQIRPDPGDRKGARVRSDLRQNAGAAQRH